MKYPSLLGAGGLLLAALLLTLSEKPSPEESHPSQGLVHETQTKELSNQTPRLASIPVERPLAALESRLASTRAHRCGSDCQHTKASGPIHWQELELSGLKHPSKKERLTLKAPGMALELTGTLLFATQREAHLQEAFRLNDGSTLFIAHNGDYWEGNITHPTQARAFLLRGGPQGQQIRQAGIDQVLCARVTDKTYGAGLPAIDGELEPADSTASDGDFTVAEAQPALNSLPNANGAIYLDFDGELVSGTNWNASFTDGADINAAAAPFTNAQIESIWRRTAEDFAPFNVTVTTDRSVYDSYPSNRRTMVIYTPTNEWYGAAGGVAYVNIFGSTNDSPAWVFTDQLSNSGSFAHEAGSHEAGHTLGLYHDGTTSSEYYGGNSLWGPIMGGAYNPSVVQWSKGEYSNANNTEDDLSIIANTRNGLGYRLDDHNASSSGASPVSDDGGGAFSASGLIERESDIDTFSLSSGAGELTINVNNFADDPNLDIKLTLRDGAGNPVASYDSTSSMDASITTTVNAGTYYLSVEGTGNGDPSTGYSAYGSLGSYSISGTAPANSDLAANIISPSISSISLPLGTGLILQGEALNGPPAWSVISAPEGASVSFSNPSGATSFADFSALGNYQIRLSVSDGNNTESADLLVLVEDPSTLPQTRNRGPRVELGPDRDVYNFETTPDPLIADDGVSSPLSYQWSVLSGDITLSDASAANPLISFNQPGAASLRLVVSDGQIQCYDEVTLNSRFLSQSLISTSATGRVLVPTDGSLDGQWLNPGFNDSSWQSGPLGVGFDASKGNETRRLFAPYISPELDIQASMYEQQSSCYLRVPFNLENAAAVLKLELAMQFDDGFVAYINGTEVARSNAPAGSPTWNSRSSRDRNDQDALSAVIFPLDISQVNLVDGTNVLAIHGLNSAIAGRGVKEPNFLLLPSLDGILAEGLPTASPFERSVEGIVDSTLKDPGDDPDEDGLDNLTEHAFKLDPTNSSSFEAIRPLNASTIELRLPANPPTDVEYVLESSPSLAAGDWTTVSSRNSDGSWTGTQPSTGSSSDPNDQVLLFPHNSELDLNYRLLLRLITP